jgi:hypothetical protein
MTSAVSEHDDDQRSEVVRELIKALGEWLLTADPIRREIQNGCEVTITLHAADSDSEKVSIIVASTPRDKPKTDIAPKTRALVSFHKIDLHPSEARATPGAVVDIQGCIRCGGVHDQLEVKALTRSSPSADGQDFTHWASCPTNGEPIFIRQVQANCAPTDEPQA